MVFGIVVLVLGSALAADQESLLLQVKLHGSQPGKYQLQLKLTNTSQNSVTIYDTDLPWIPPNQLVLVKQAYRMNNRRSLLEKFTPMEDYARTPNQLAPGGSLADTIDLNTMFPSLESEIKKYGVIIEWVCRSKKIEFRCKEGKGGQFVIAKSETRNSGKTSSLTSPSPTIQKTK